MSFDVAQEQYDRQEPPEYAERDPDCRNCGKAWSNHLVELDTETGWRWMCLNKSGDEFDEYTDEDRREEAMEQKWSENR